MKRVTIGIELDSSFVRLLNENVALSGLREKDELSPLEQLGLMALLEARGAHQEQVWASILPCWMPHLDVVPSLRSVKEDQEMSSG